MNCKYLMNLKPFDLFQTQNTIFLTDLGLGLVWLAKWRLSLRIFLSKTTKPNRIWQPFKIEPLLQFLKWMNEFAFPAKQCPDPSIHPQGRWGLQNNLQSGDDSSLTISICTLVHSFNKQAPLGIVPIPSIQKNDFLFHPKPIRHKQMIKIKNI